MTIVALTGLKGSPGVTTLATALAATWPRQDDSPILLIEADPAGGVLGPRHHISAEPSLASYMADARRGFDPAIAAGNSQELVPGVRALIGPVDPAVAERSLSWGASALADGLVARPHLPVVVDLGRLDAVSPAAPLAQAATETLLVIRPSLEQAAIGVHRARSLIELGCRVGLVCVGTGPDDPGDVAHAMGIGLAGVIPEADNAAAILRDAYAGKRRARRTLLWQSINALSEGVAQRAAAAVHGIPMPNQTGAEPNMVEPNVTPFGAAQAGEWAGEGSAPVTDLEPPPTSYAHGESITQAPAFAHSAQPTPEAPVEAAINPIMPPQGPPTMAAHNGQQSSTASTTPTPPPPPPALPATEEGQA